MDTGGSHLTNVPPNQPHMVIFRSRNCNDLDILCLLFDLSAISSLKSDKNKMQMATYLIIFFLDLDIEKWIDYISVSRNCIKWINFGIKKSQY